MSEQEAITQQVAREICKHWPRDPNGCAAICLDRLGLIPKEGCRHAMQVHGKMAKAVIRVVLEGGEA